MKKVIYLLACVAFLGCYSCSDDDDGLKMQDISVEFAVSDAGMDGTGIDLGIKLSRATKESLDVTVQMISTEVSESDITVTPTTCVCKTPENWKATPYSLTWMPFAVRNTSAFICPNIRIWTN